MDNKTKITALPDAPVLTDDSLVVGVANGKTSKITLSTLKNAVVGDLADLLTRLDTGGGV